MAKLKAFQGALWNTLWQKINKTKIKNQTNETLPRRVVIREVPKRPGMAMKGLQSLLAEMGEPLQTLTTAFALHRSRPI